MEVAGNSRCQFLFALFRGLKVEKKEERKKRNGRLERRRVGKGEQRMEAQGSRMLASSSHLERTPGSMRAMLCDLAQGHLRNLLPTLYPRYGMYWAREGNGHFLMSAPTQHLDGEGPRGVPLVTDKFLLLPSPWLSLMCTHTHQKPT